MTAKPKQIDEISGKEVEQRVFRFLVPYIGNQRFLLAFSISLLIPISFATLYAPKLLGRIVDEALVPKNHDQLIFLAGIFFGMMSLRHLSTLAYGYFLQKVGQQIMHNLRRDLFGRLMRMPMPFFDRIIIGKLVTRITNDVSNLTELFGPGFVSLIADIITITGVMVMMLLLHFELGLITIAIFPLMMFAMNHFSKMLRAAFRDSRTSLSRLNGYFAERMSGMQLIQLMGMEPYERKRYKEFSDNYKDKQRYTISIFALFNPTITILSACSVACVLFFGGRYVLAGEIQLGVFVAFLAYVQTLFQPIRSLTEKYNIFQNAMASAERIFSMIHLQEEEGLRKHQKYALNSFKGEIRFENIFFSYEQEEKDVKKWALRNANFDIKAGEKIAVIGHTGAGKTTLLSLLFRFYETQKGQIRIDGKEIQEISKTQLRDRIGFVQQDIFIFAGTVRENLCLLRDNITEKELETAIQATGMDKIISKLPEGIDSKLDERGSNLSLGERQVLAFTRVLLQQPDIIVLDEATSHIDSESEQMIQQAMNKIIEGRTSIIIAHRLATIKDVDRVFVFSEGEIVENGTHEELMQNKGPYSQFLSIQNV